MKQKYIMVKVTEEYRNEVRKMAHKHEMTISGLIRWLIDKQRKEDEKMRRMDEYNCGDCARFYSVDEWNGECSKHGCVNCMSKICKDFILNDMRKEDEGK